jgi:pinin/SDK/memA/ protein conserved region
MIFSTVHILGIWTRLARPKCLAHKRTLLAPCGKGSEINDRAMISSAVILPETEGLSPPSPSQKRRQSSTSYNDSFKRPRLDVQPSQDSNGDSLSSSATSPPRRLSSVTGRGAAEERKRGQRLFGALLGTLSQSSTTTAQRRRADIEKKQLGKLQQRDEELEEEKRKKREKLDVVRRKEQGIWDEQSV